MRHELKTWPEPFDAVWLGHKHHEIRRDDRHFTPGDTLVLREWDPATETYSGREVEALVTYKTRGGEWGIPDGLCVLSMHAVRAVRVLGRQAAPRGGEGQ